MQIKKMQKAQKDKTKPISKFIINLYNILQNQQFGDLVAWSSNGRSFVIRDSTQFEEKVLLKYFKHQNFASFLRQLNMYSFIKRKSSGKCKEYMHLYLRRNEEVLLGCIERKRELKQRRKRTSNQKNYKKLINNCQQNLQAKNCQKIYQLVHFNRKLLEQNTILWQHFFGRSLKQSDELQNSRNSMGELDTQISDLQENTSRVSQIINQMRRMKEEESKNIEFSFEEILKQYDLIKQIVEDNIDREMVRDSFSNMQ